MKIKTSKQKAGYAALLGVLLTLALLAGCAKDQPAPDPQPPEPAPSVAEQLTNQDFATMAENKLEYLGEAPAVGKVLGLSLLAPYNTKGFEMQTTQQPYQIIAEYTIPAEANAAYTDTDVEMMTAMTAFNCFILINNVDEVALTVDYTAAGGSAQQFSKVWQRQTFDDMCEIDVRTLADNPQLWATAVKAYVEDTAGAAQ